MSVNFPAMWCGTNLGKYRRCRGTYESYPIDSLPPLDQSRLIGTFAWLGDPGELVLKHQARLGAIDAELAREGLKLPQDFITFQTRSKLRHALDNVSVTCCWTHIVGPVPSPVEKGAYLVQFLRDQQDCCAWYLYLRPGETFVVYSSHLYTYVDPDSDLDEHAGEILDEFLDEVDYDLEDDPEDFEQVAEDDGDGNVDEDDLGEADDPEISIGDLPAHIYRCAPTFEELAYRFWLESSLWRVIHGGKREMTSEEREYLQHYGFKAV